MAPTEDQPKEVVLAANFPRVGVGRRVWRFVWRTPLYALALYAGVVLIGLIPVNNGFQPSPGGVEVWLTSSPIHADVMLPIETSAIDWREEFPADCFAGETSQATHVAIGWGDRGFFIHTPTWADLRFSTAAKALLWPSETCLHVSLTRAEYFGDDARSVFISEAEYERLVDYVRASFQRRADGSVHQIDDAAYSSNDAFFRARGRYHCLNTCNSWVGRGLQAAGVRTGWLTPLPKTLFWYLPSGT